MVDFHAIQQVGNRQHGIFTAVLFPAAIGVGKGKLAGKGAGRDACDTQDLNLRHGVTVQLDGSAGLGLLVHHQDQKKVRLLVVHIAFRGLSLKLV